MVASVLKLKAGHMEDPKGPIIDPYSIPSPLDVIDSRLDSASSSPTVSTRGEKKRSMQSVVDLTNSRWPCALAIRKDSSMLEARDGG